MDGKAPDDALWPKSLQREIYSGQKPHANGHAGPTRTLLFLDTLRLSRDCLTEAIAEHCPDLHVMGLHPKDFDAEALNADVALIILNLHDAPLGAASRLALQGSSETPPPLLVITNKEESAASIEAMQDIIAGLVRADAHIELLMAAIRLVMAGGRYYPADRLISRMRRAPLIRTPR